MPVSSGTTDYQNRPIAGAMAVISASLLIAVVGALVKIVAVELPNEMVVFFRNICTLMVILPWTFARRGAESIKTDCLHLHVFRSLAGLGAMYCFFYAISHLKLSEAFLLMSTSPLFIPIIAFVWMGESASARIRWAIVIGFVGVALILKPGFGLFKPAALVGLGTGILSAMAMVSIRRMSNTEPAVRIVFYFTVLAALVSVAPLAWTWKAPSAALWPLLLLMGAMAAFGQLLLTKGYSLAPAAQVGAFMYANVFFATLMGWTFWEETLDVLSVAGALLIIAAGIITTRRTSTPAAAYNTTADIAETGSGSIGGSSRRSH